MWMRPCRPESRPCSTFLTFLGAADVAFGVLFLKGKELAAAQRGYGVGALGARSFPAGARAALVALLLKHSADTCRADNEGYTCLHWAAACGADSVVKQLAEAGATPSQRSYATHSPRPQVLAVRL